MNKLLRIFSCLYLVPLMALLMLNTAYADDTPETAIPVNLDSSTPASIDRINDTDFYRFTISETTDISIQTTGVDIRGEILDELGNFISTDDIPNDGNFSFRITLAPGTYFILISAFDSSVLGDYTLQINTVFDNHGNEANTATQISIGSTTAGEIGVGGDVDFFRFDITTTTLVSLKTEGSTDTVGTLFDASLNEIIENNVIGGSNFQITQALNPGIYFLSVRGSNLSTTGSYTLITEALLDDHGNAPNTATQVNLNSTTPGVIDVPGDVDFYRIDVNATSLVRLKTESNLTTSGTLFDASLNTISEDNSFVGDFDILHTLTPGTYFLSVGGSFATTEGNYSLTVEIIPDDHGNSANTATAIGLNSTTAGSIDIFRDVDFFRLEITAATKVNFQTSGLVGTTGTLFDASMNQLAQSNQGSTVIGSPSSQNFRIAISLSPGTYFLSVQKTGSFDDTNYTLFVETIEDDHGDTAQTATPVTLDSTVTGRYDAIGDIEFFRLDITETTDVVLLSSSTFAKISATLFDSSQNALISSSNGGIGNDNFRIITTLTPGTYFLSLQNSSSTLASYTLFILPFEDDHGDTIETATLLTPDISTAGELNFPTDIDLFRLDLDTSSDVFIKLDSRFFQFRLLDENSNELNVSSGGSVTTRLAAGAYYIRVTPVGGGARIDSYSLSYTLISDAHSNDAQSATTINLNSVTPGFITESDIDIFRFDISRTIDAVIEAVGTEFDTNTSGILLDSNLQPITSDTNSGDGGDFQIRTQLNPGTYFIQVMPESDGFGPYNLRLTEDDHADDSSSATNIALNSTTPGTLSFTRDIDYFRFNLFSNTEVVIETTGNHDTAVFLLDTNLDILDGDNNSGEGSNGRIIRTLNAGSYFIFVRSEFATGTGDYTLNLSSINNSQPLALPGTATIQLGQSISLQPLQGTAVSYRSINSSVVQVNNSGVIVGAGLGTTTVVGTDAQGNTSSTEVTVTRVRLAVPPSITLQVGQETILATTRGLASLFTANNTGIVSVRNFGNVSGVSAIITALAAGTSIITATDGNLTAQTTVTVIDAPVSIDLPQALTVEVGQDRQLVSLQGEANAFTSSNNGVATVTLQGVVTGVSAGTAVITGTDVNGNSDTTTVTVTAPVTIEDPTPPDINAAYDNDNDHTGDNMADILLRNQTTGQWRLYPVEGRFVQFDSTNFGVVPVITNSTTLQTQDVSDYTGDGLSDVLMRNTSSGSWQLVELSGKSLRSSIPVSLDSNLDWQFIAAEDFTGDGKTDVVLRHAVNGTWRLFPMDENGVIQDANLGFIGITPSLDWQLVAASDFNGDGFADIVLRNQVSGLWLMLPMQGRTVMRNDDFGGIGITQDLAWEVAGAKDITGDGKADLLLRHNVRGQWLLLPMNGKQVDRGENFGGIRFLTTDLSWQPAQVDDFTGDGRADVLVRNNVTGAWRMHPMVGKTVVRDANFGGVAVTPDLNWELQ